MICQLEDVSEQMDLWEICSFDELEQKSVKRESLALLEAIYEGPDDAEAVLERPTCVVDSFRRLLCLQQ